jgi:hypothetical protein
MIRAQGTIQEVCIRIVSIAAVTLSLFACSQATEPPAMNNTTLGAAPQKSDMVEVVISASRGTSRPRG